MRVGVDARLLSEKLTGIGRYTVETTRELIKQQGKFVLYSARPIDSCQWQHNNVTLRTANFHSRPGRMFWSQTYLPYWSSKDSLDVFWGATHRLPNYLPASVARVVTIHDLVWKHAGDTMRPSSRWLEKQLMPRAVRQADRVITDSQSTAQAIEEEYPSLRGRIRVVYPGATDFPRPLDSKILKSLNIHKPYFLFVGTLEPRKNLRRLLKAFSMLDSETRSRYLLVIAGGEGWGGVRIDALINEFQLNGQVVMLGYVNDVELSTLYAHSRFLAMPSVYEGFGLPLVEAMSFGVPVLTSNCSSMPEVAGEAGILVEPFDEHSIAEGLDSLLSDDQLRAELAKKAVSNVERFNWQNAARQIWAVFLEAKDERSGLQGGRN